MADIATLGIKVTTDGVAQASGQLDKLGKSSATASRQLDQGAKSYDKMALSAKQLQAAQRQLPMQFTDIFTGLASGQRPLQVFLQQGGQLKDVFGGIGPALRASAGYIMGLVSPFTLAAGAAIGFAVALSQVQERQNAIDRALILTGRYTSDTAEGLRELSREMDNISGVTAGSAAKAIAQVAETGRFTADQLETVAVAAETWRAATGTAVEDTIKQFVKLREDPVRAALELNRTYNFLGQSTLEQARKFVEMGRDADAAAVVVNAFAADLNSKAPQMEAQVGAIAGAFRGLKRSAREAWDQVVEGMDKAFEKMRDRAGQFGGLPGMFTNATLLGLQRAGGRGGAKPDFSRVTTGPIVDTEAELAREQAAKEFERFRIANLTRAERLEKEIADIREAGRKAGVAELEIEKQIAAARERYAEAKPRGRLRTAETDPTNSILASIQQQIALNNAAAESEDRLTASETMRVRVLEQLGQLGDKVSAGRRAEVEAALQQLAISDQLSVAADKERRAREEAARVAEREAEAHKRRMEANEQLISDMQFEIQLLGMSEKAREREIALRYLSADATDEQRNAVASLADEMFRAREADRNWMDLRDSMADGFADIVLGAESAKDAIRNFFDSIAEQITRSISKNWADSLTDMLRGASDGAGGGGGGWFSSLMGALFGGGRAIGGPVSKGKVYRVNEKGAPEMFDAGGRQYMLAPKNGHVRPAAALDAGSGVVVQQAFYIQGKLDGSTRDQLARRSGREVESAMRKA